MTEFDSRLEVGDCRGLLARLPAGCADLVFADPPFNIGYKYDQYDDRRPKEKYLQFADEWLAACLRVLAPTGSMFVAIGADYVAEHKVRLDALGLTMRNWIVWHYTFGPHLTGKFGRDHAHILYYSRHRKRRTFNADPVRIESARQRAGDKRADPRGRVPGDVWQFAPDEFGAEVWEVPRLPGNAKERTGHPCQMPEAVLERIVLAASNPGDLVIDPFAGSGTTLAVAKRLGRRWYGCELSESYAERIRKRLNDQPTEAVA